MEVRNTIGLNDQMTRILQGIVRTLNVTISTMQRLDSQSDIIGSDALNLLRGQIRATETELQDLERLLNGLGSNAPPRPPAFNNWHTRLMGIYSGVQLIMMGLRQLGKVADLADEFVSVNARLSLINDGLQTQASLQEKVLKSANATRSSYEETANLITKIGMSKAITNNDEQIAFAEKVNKLLKIGGGTSAMNQSALLQLSQSLSSGVMQGDEFRSLMENAPALMANIAKGMGTNVGSLRQLAREGKLTTDVIINSLNNMGSEIDEQFNKLPRTFGENKTVLTNVIGDWLAKLSSANGALGKLNQKFTELTNFLSSAEGVALLDNIAFGLNIIMALILGFFDIIQNGIGLIDSFGGVFEGLFAGLIIVALTVIIGLLWKKVAALWAMVPPLYAQAKGWAIAHLPIVLIASAIGLVVFALKHMGLTTRQVVGVMSGFLTGLIVVVTNIAFFFFNIFGQIAVFLKNIFIDPVFAIKNLFYGVISAIAGFFQNLINGIIDGLNFIIGAANKVGGGIEELKHTTFADDFNKNFKPESSKNVETWDNKYLDLGEYSNKGAEFGMKAFDSFSDKFSTKGIGDGVGLGASGVFGENKNIGDIGKVDKVGSIEKDVNIADEDMKMLYQMAVGDRVNQINLTVQTSAPVITNNNSISSEIDVNSMFEQFGAILNEQSNIAVKQSY